MKNTVFFLLILAIAGYAQFDGKTRGTNITQWTDTVLITGLKEAGTVRYSTVLYDISADQPMRIIAMVNDTDAAGLTADSVNVQWGYQTGCRVLNASGLVDTAWYNRVTVDTLVTASFGTMAVSTISPNGAPTMATLKNTDTLSVTGWAVQPRPISPLWDEFMRIWANGLAGTNLSSGLKLKFLVKQQVAQPVRAK